MKKFILSAFLPFVIAISFTHCAGTKNTSPSTSYTYKPDNQKLYDTIVYLDSLFFSYYNTCEENLDKYAAFYSDSIEFYHDQGGLMTSKPAIVEATRVNICGKVTRHLVKGSIEVYPIKDYGAVEMGLHSFHNNQEPQHTQPKIGRFVVVWQRVNNGWKISRVISLH